ncbi:MAG: DNA-binding protein WhiA [Defluviitaleaceae bacterium]|nr:DNA-binding protein WhiA [Defluviitaleaceae bacterium]
MSAKVPDTPRHCVLAEMAALMLGAGRPDCGGISLSGHNIRLVRRFAELAAAAFGRQPAVSVVPAAAHRDEPRAGRRQLTCSVQGTGREMRIAASELADEALLVRECCKRAYIRGAFLAGGSLSDPAKHYHLEFTCHDSGSLKLLRSAAEYLGADVRVTLRKSAEVLYVKDGEAIAHLLNIMGAHKAMMELENVRILKDVRNNVNRKVNFETANLSKTVDAAVSQVADIHYILDSGEFGRLSQNLADAARLRLEYPSASLREIGERLLPAVSKSAVNHRLRKISCIAEKLRGEQG